jgi:hypothetical protein
MSKIVKSVFGWKSTLIVLAVFLFTIFGKESLGKIEGDLFPVTTTAEISLIESEEYSSLFWGSIEKLRECEFQRIEWKLGDSSNSIEVGVSFEESSKVRPEGIKVLQRCTISVIQCGQR